MILRALLLVMALTAPAAAEDRPMTGEEFRAFAEGHTLHFRDGAGNYFGTEQYLSSNRTVWLPRGGQCLPGIWAEEGENICFLYHSGTSCWTLFADGEEGIYARNADNDGGPVTELWLLKKDQRAVVCPDAPGA
ncbi:MAG: hypothetical protein AAF367_16005 [Pseudomonadota bacterium]